MKKILLITLISFCLYAENIKPTQSLLDIVKDSVKKSNSKLPEKHNQDYLSYTKSVELNKKNQIIYTYIFNFQNNLNQNKDLDFINKNPEKINTKKLRNYLSAAYRMNAILNFKKTVCSGSSRDLIKKGIPMAFKAEWDNGEKMFSTVINEKSCKRLRK